MKANSDKSKQSNKATRRVLAGVLCGASVLSLVLSLVMPPVSQAIANDDQAVSAEEAVADEGALGEDAGADNSTGKDAENQNNDVAEGDEGEDAAAADPAADGAEAKGAVQPADDGQSVYKVATVANEGEVQGLQKDSNGYTLLKSDGDLAAYLDASTKPEKLRLAADISSSDPITISQNTTIDLAGHKLYYYVGNNDTFITVASGALTIEDSVKPSDNKTSTVDENNPGQLATMTWTGNNNGTPQSLTYYETTSTPSTDRLGTTETTTKHVVSGFGAIVAASEGGLVKQVISVEDGGTLNLSGGMITTPRTLGDNGHVIFSQGAVNISGGYVTNGNGGGWGGGLCMAKGSLNMTDGVIAANKAAAGGGIFADNSVTLTLSGGVISGNATYAKGIGNTCGGDTGDGGYGGGAYTKGANVTIGGSANITNNRVDAWIADSNLYNFGLLGGGGIACTHGGTLTMTGGSVTANYSKEAGGGIYAGFHSQPIIKFSMTGGTIAGNESENAEGGGLRISNGTTGDIKAEPSTSSKIYITNNKTMTGEGRGGDWGGGGVFIQQGGKLNIVKTLITQNDAGGWGGGVAACPTGETIVSHSNGAAIYNNTDHGLSDHMSAGGNGKNEDSDAEYVTDTFKEAGHKDFFLVRKKESADKTVAVVLGKMLGGVSAGWQGTCDNTKITIDANGGAEAKYMFGLEAHPTEDAITKAQAAATTIISGNYSYTHGGGIMTNGDLTVGKVDELSVYPNMKLNATKVLVDADGNSQKLEGHPYKFKLLRQDSVGTKAPSWKEGDTLDMGDCSGAGEATVDQSNGSITFDSGKDYSSGQYVFYLVEEPISGKNELGTKFDKTIYKIVVTVDSNPYKTDYLMSIPIKYYTVKEITVSKKTEKDPDFKPLGSESYSVDYSSDYTTATVTIGGGENPTFTNGPYTSTGSWTPAATKVVEGGEMKKFTLQLATDSEFNTIVSSKFTTAGGDNPQTQDFPTINYTLDSLKQSDTDVPGRGASKTFTYYMREKNDSSIFSHYKFDNSVYKFTVVAKDETNGNISCKVTYRKGTVDSDGTWKNTDTVDHELTPKSIPTFTNTYSTSLPLSGMSGVTLTYLAGAAVLCAAAAWMHIRRKANVKGGKRRE